MSSNRIGLEVINRFGTYFSSDCQRAGQERLQRRAFGAITEATRLTVRPGSIKLEVKPLRPSQIPALERHVGQVDYDAGTSYGMEKITEWVGESICRDWGSEDPVFDWDPEELKIHLFWIPTVILAQEMGMPVENLAYASLCNAYAHAFLQIGANLDGRTWPTRKFVYAYRAQRGFIESIANYFTHGALLHTSCRDSGAFEAHLGLLQRQPQKVYRGHFPWLADSELEAYLNSGLIQREAPSNSQRVSMKDRLRMKSRMFRETAGHGRVREVEYRPIQPIAEIVRKNLLKVRDAPHATDLEMFTRMLDLESVYISQVAEIF
ncbi:MAG: hypothetical protein ACI96M_000418 [Candidatus Azotimanducaceae bacterium]|jgi:hypothetical protein